MVKTINANIVITDDYTSTKHTLLVGTKVILTSCRRSISSECGVVADIIPQQPQSTWAQASINPIYLTW